MGVDEVVATVALCDFGSEGAVRILLTWDLVEITLDADMAELLPPIAVGRVDVIIGANVIATLGFNGEDLVGFGVGFEGSAELYVFRGEPTVVSTSACLTLNLLAISPNKFNSWARRLDGRSDSPATMLEII